MSITVDHLTRTAPTWGFPHPGDRRRVTPLALLCLHCTANTATAQAERDYANRRTDGVSAHDYLDRDGSGVEAIDPAVYAAWSNGVLNRPASANPTIAAIANMAHPERGGYNPNELVYREIECVGTSPSASQLVTVAGLVAADAETTGLPIDERTVLLHADFDSVNRSNCPCPPADHERVRQAVISLAQGGGITIVSVALKAEDWTPTTSGGQSNGVFRAIPDRASPVIGRVPAGTVVRTVAEVATNAAGSDADWRETRWNGQSAFVLRSDWTPVKQGGDPAVDAQLTALIERQTPGPALRLFHVEFDVTAPSAPVPTITQS